MSSSDRCALDSVETTSDLTVSESLGEEERLEVIHLGRTTEGVSLAEGVLGDEHRVRVTSDLPRSVVTNEDVSLELVIHS